MRHFLIILVIALGIASSLYAAPAYAVPHGSAHKKSGSSPHTETVAELYHRAFTAITDNNPQAAETIIARGPDPILNKVISGYAMGLAGNDYSFEQMNAFIAGNPGWPGLKAIQMIAEQKIPSNAVPSQVVSWFNARPPLTLQGFYRYIDALNASGQGDSAATAIRARWVEFDFSGDELATFYQRFGSLLDEGSMWARMDRLLWKSDAIGARRMMPYLNATDQALAQARLALSEDNNVDAWLSRVPTAAQSDPGLLYQRLRWLVKHNRDEDADNILLNPPSDLGKPEPWWDQRQIMMRRAMESHDYNLAYRLAADNGQTETKQIVQAEFLCGWLALRFLNQPDIATQHFQNLLDNATTPITRARGSYWLGRAYEAAGNRNAAEQSYEDAAVFNSTYYGQLAETRLYANPVLTAKADPPMPDSARRVFYNRDIIRAILRLNDIGESDRAKTFFHAAADSATERAEFVVLTEIALKMRRPDLGISAVKAAAQKDMQVENGGFPILTSHPPTPPEAAFTHALIKQESMFNPEAESAVGARGLMQLMPGTAKDMARHLDMRYSESRLLDIDFNLKLGTAFVQEQIDHFNGSYIMALAGYNAGPARVHEWVSEFGDPRTGDVDPIDWVEMIPIQETRNYVQRIIENLQIYRAKLAGGSAPLLILNDLKR